MDSRTDKVPEETPGVQSVTDTGSPTSGASPVHIGIIMDGNGRWATTRNLPRTKGHQAGIEAVKRVILAAANAGVQYVSLYSFSTENWKRAPTEVEFLMQLVARNLRNEYDFYRDNQIRLFHSGDLSGLPKAVRKEIATVTADTRTYNGITVNIAVNYGGRNEIIRAFNRYIKDNLDKPLTTEDILREYLDLPDFPDPDLIIRSGGHRRISNFLLWQSAYSELYFSDKLWPDWEGSDLTAAISDFKARKRNYGGTK